MPPLPPHPRQPIPLRQQRTFQQPNLEPLGSNYGESEMQALRSSGQAGAAAVRRAQSNADPVVAQWRRDVACAERVLVSLPPGEQGDAVAQSGPDLRSMAERAAANAKLPVTTGRAGKQVRRQQGRPEGRHASDRVIKAMLPGRAGTKRRRQDEKDGEAFDIGDQYQAEPKRGMATNKVRGLLLLLHPLTSLSDDGSPGAVHAGRKRTGTA